MHVTGSPNSTSKSRKQNPPPRLPPLKCDISMCTLSRLSGWTSPSSTLSINSLNAKKRRKRSESFEEWRPLRKRLNYNLIKCPQIILCVSVCEKNRKALKMLSFCQIEADFFSLQLCGMKLKWEFEFLIEASPKNDWGYAEYGGISM